MILYTNLEGCINFYLIKQQVITSLSCSDRILFELKLGRQASAYKVSQKAINRFIQEIKLIVDNF